jgi:hypothetical protein
MQMKKIRWVWMLAVLSGFSPFSLPVESGMYRLLSISDSEKLILVSQIPSKTKYLLDASAAKIMVNGKAAEFKELQIFSVIQVKLDLRKSSKNGIAIDGLATEIKINPMEKVK